MEPLKEMFNKTYFELLADTICSYYPYFKKSAFLKAVLTNLQTKSLNERMYHCSEQLHAFLPLNYSDQLEILKQVVTQLPTGYTTLVFPDFVSKYGLNDTKNSLEALKYFTPFGSSEFAIRHFLRFDFKTTFAYIEEWANDDNEHVRRLATEGTRPRLPWSFKLDAVIHNPHLTLPLLTRLNNDTSLYVRKSVANHLNDITKEHPDIVLNTVSKWDLKSPNTKWIVKHGLRTLIKKGDKKSLALFGFKKNSVVAIHALQFDKTTYTIGEAGYFSFEIENTSNEEQFLAIDFIIHFQKSSGTRNPKVFKLKEITLAAGQKQQISKKQGFENFSTRQHFPGEHLLEIQVNGDVKAGITFDLTH